MLVKLTEIEILKADGENITNPIFVNFNLVTAIRPRAYGSHISFALSEAKIAESPEQIREIIMDFYDRENPFRT